MSDCLKDNTMIISDFVQAYEMFKEKSYDKAFEHVAEMMVDIAK